MRTVLFGVLSAALTFSAPVTLVQPAPGGSLTGKVISGSGLDAEPVRRAKVTLTGAGLTPPRVADTDTDGGYRFDRLPQGSFKLRVQKPGFVTLDGDAAPNATLTMTRGGAIEGVVGDLTGEPVWNVIVRALRVENGKPTPAAQARTDDLGRYRIYSLPAGDYLVEVATDRSFIDTFPLVGDEKYPQINKSYYPAATAIEDAKPVLVMSGRDATGVDVTFTPALPVVDPSVPPRASRIDGAGNGRIAGVVTDAVTGKPIRAAQVVLTPVSSQGPRITNVTRTDAQGRFEYTALSAQRYTLRAQARRFITLGYGQTRAGTIAKEIPVQDGDDIRADIKLPRTSALEGTILDEFGEPAPNVVVQLAQRQYVAGRRRLRPALGDPPTTDDRGHYRVTTLNPGDYYVMALSGAYAEASQVGGFAPTYYPGTIDSAGAIPVTVPFAADAPMVTFALVASKTFSVSGTMLGSDGRAVGGGGTVWLLTPDRLERMDFNIARGATMSDGTFALRNVPQGQYTLQGFAPAPPGYRGPGNLGAMPFGWLPIAVGDADLDGLVLKTSGGTKLRGKLVTEDSSAPPLAAKQVSVMTVPVEFDAAPIAGGPSPYEGRDDLTFEMTRQSGLRRILVTTSGPWTLKKITLDGQEITDTAVDLRDKDVEGVEIVLTARVSRVAGGVSDDTGPIADFVVVIFPSDPTKWIDRSRFVAFARSTPQGRFVSQALPPEDYLAIALPGASLLEIYDPDWLQSLRALATSFTLTEGETKTLELKLHRRP